MAITHCDQLEAGLEDAIRRFRRERAAARRREETGWELRFLFSRLGLSIADLDVVARAPGGRDLPAPLRAGLADRLESERRRLMRLARSGSARYDAGRHLAVRAAIRWLADRPAGEEGGDAARLSGAALNRRFRRLRARRAVWPAAA